MLSIEIEIDEFPSEAILKAIDRGASLGLDTGADEITILAKMIAPKGSNSDGVGLAESIQNLGPTGVFSEDTLEARVAAGAPHAVFIEFGTGIFLPGGQPWYVEPVNRKVLRWETGDGYAFSKGHWVEGMPAQPFLIPAMKVGAQRVAQEIGSAIELQFLLMED